MSLQVGDTAALRRQLGQDVLDQYATLSGDDNPIHVDPAYAAATPFGGTVAHGMLLWGQICRLLGSALPGPGTQLLTQSLMFPHPTPAGEAITVAARVLRLAPSRQEATLATTVSRGDGQVGCQGEAVVRLPGALPGTPVSPPRAVAGSPGAAAMGALALGQSAALTRTWTAADLDAYVALTGDENPAYAGAEALHPGLLAGLISCLLGTSLPGRGANWLKQTLHFPGPARLHRPVTARVTIVRLRPEKRLVTLRTECLQHGALVCHGTALVLAREASWVRAGEEDHVPL